MAHLARSLEDFHCFSDIREASSFGLGIFEDACYSCLEDSTDEGAKKDAIAQNSLEV